jgi:hypothetical protein
MKSIKAELDLLEAKSLLVLKKYEILEEFCVDISDEEGENIWKLISMPKKISEEMATCEATAQQEKYRMIRELSNNQSQFNDALFKLAEKAAVVETFHSIENAISCDETVASIYEEFQELEKLSNLYATYEKILKIAPMERTTLTLSSLDHCC